MEQETREYGSDDWDDTLLIKAYDNSLKVSKQDLAKSIAEETNRKKNAANCPSKNIKMKTVDDLKEGDYVRATYIDGIDYEAKILSINRDKGTCVLKYVGYGNEQEIKICDLVPSWGKKARKMQFNKSKQFDGTKNLDDLKNMKKGNLRYISCSSSKMADSTHHLPPPPPIPPMLNEPNEDSENFSAMLMSWYMSGYYTGLYQGQKYVKTGKKCFN